MQQRLAVRFGHVEMALVDRDQRDVVERGQVCAQRQVEGDPRNVVGSAATAASSAVRSSWTVRCI
jgi:hypothetical protein